MSNGRYDDDYEYAEQPIRRTGVFRNASPNVPSRILKMEALYDPGLSTAEDKRRNFYVQAKYMEDYEIDYDPHCRFQRWFPAYHDMREDQLLSYFGWRTKVRHGEYVQSEEAFAYVYLYELINLIGGKDAVDCFRKLEEFRENYVRKYKMEELDSFLLVWLKQFCVCYSLPAEITEKYYAEEVKQDRSLLALYTEDSSRDEVYKALCELSSYKVESSTVYKKYPEEYKELLCRIWRALNRTTWMKSTGNLFEYCFGRKDQFITRFFSNAVYFERYTEPRTYAVDPARVFTYKNNRWYYECFRTIEMKSRVLGTILREADRQLRDFFETGHPLQKKEVSGTTVLGIRKVLEDYRQEKEEAARPKIMIRKELLVGIREDADITREKLLTEEERIDRMETETEEKTEETVKEYPFGLTEEEAVFLRMLKEQEDWGAYLKKKRIMPSIISESINEKLFDEIGDTLIVFDGDIPELQEDYIEELEDLWEE